MSRREFEKASEGGPPAMSRIPVRMREPRRSGHIDNAAPSATAHGSPPQVPRSDADRTPRSGRSCDTRAPMELLVVPLQHVRGLHPQAMFPRQPIHRQRLLDMILDPFH